jgi:hypothetical protein
VPEELIAMFVWLISLQPTVLFSQNKPATSNQPTILLSQNKSAPAISHQPNERLNIICMVRLQLFDYTPNLKLKG